ncbi:MAG: TonB-dependent receptor [Gammaproteobacteria bacterium]|nr:TonB-dependent receptor [Gammaproteobacteria bacterium]
MFRNVIAFSAVILANSSLTAQSNTATINEIIVTADYRKSNALDISSSISVVGAEIIEKKNAHHLEEILLNAPNVNSSSGSSRARFYQIRGIGERGQFSEPLNSSVGVIIDGIDFSGIGTTALLYDVEQVEILLGPQGTRYGSNALAGLINIASKSPSSSATYGLQLENANYDGKGLSGYLSGPIAEKLRYRFSAQNHSTDGFNNNQFLKKNTSFRDERIMRGQLEWSPSEHMQIDVISSFINIDNGYDAFSLDNTRDTLSDAPGADRQKSKTVSANLSLTQFEKFTVETLLGYANSKIDYGYDEDWVFDGFHPWEYSSTDQYLRKKETKSGEIRFVSTDSGLIFSDTTDWVFGVYVLQQQSHLQRNYTFLPENFYSKYRTNRSSAYAELNSQLGENWNLTLGVRAEHFNAAYNDSNEIDFAPNKNLFGGKAALTYTTGQDNILYASVSQGYKTGGFNTDGTLDKEFREFDAEKLLNYELGFKGSLYNEKVRTQVTLFFMDRDDVQISSSLVQTRSNGSSEFIEYIGNAASGSNYGLEVSGEFNATQRVMLYSSAGILKTKYKTFINSAGENLNGRQQAHAPNYQYTLGISAKLNSVLEFDANLQGRDKFYFSDSHSGQSEKYNLLNASVRYSQKDWRLTVWGRNINNQDYLVRGFFFGNDPRDNYSPKNYTQLGEPARYGITLNLDF